MDSDITLLSLAGSAFSPLCTVYFWLVRARREQPNLSAHLLEQEFFLGLGKSDVRGIGCSLSIVWANNSILPDAVLGARIWVMTKDGAWQLLDGLTCDGDKTALPLNLPPQQTGLLKLTGCLSFIRDERLESEQPIARSYVRAHLAHPRQFRIETLGLNDRISADVMTIDPDESAAESFRIRTAA